jgi:hypothetical protein
MKNFENFQFQKSPEDEIISSIFPYGGRKDFNKRVKEALDASQKSNGFRKGTSGFIKTVIGSIKLDNAQYQIIKREITKEANKIETERKKAEKEREKLFEEAESASPFKKEPTDKDKIMIEGAKKHLDEELERSGGVDPNI